MATLMAALSVMPQEAFARAALPLLASGAVDALEWTVDQGWSADQPPPPWCTALLDEFASAGRLYGHSTGFSVLSARDTPAHAAWLGRVSAERARRPYQGLSEHLGFSNAGPFVDGPPLPTPMGPATLAVGRRHLQAMAHCFGGPVGLENLAFAFTLADVMEQGALLEALLAPVDGYLVLDLHNLFCQSHNFQVPLEALLETYPLRRVRVAHISGGRWMETPKGRRRRDTHDGAVPSAVFAALEAALRRCPRLEVVVLEQLGGALEEQDAARQYQADFHALRKILERT